MENLLYFIQLKSTRVKIFDKIIVTSDSNKIIEYSKNSKIIAIKDPKICLEINPQPSMLLCMNKEIYIKII